MNYVGEERRGDHAPQVLDALLLVGEVALLEEAEMAHGVVHRAATVEVAILVVLLEDLVDGLLVEKAVVLQVACHAVELLQPELQLSVRLASADHSVPLSQLAEVLHLLLVETDLLLALLQLRDIPRVHHVDIVCQLPIKRSLACGERSLVDQPSSSPYIPTREDALKENTPVLRFPFFLQ